MSVDKGRDLHGTRTARAQRAPALDLGELIFKANHGDAEARAELAKVRTPIPPAHPVDPDGTDITPT